MKTDQPTYAAARFIADAIVWETCIVERGFQGRLLLDGIAPDPGQRELTLKSLTLHDEDAVTCNARIDTDAAGKRFIAGQIEIPVEAEHTDTSGARYYTRGIQRYQMSIPAKDLPEDAHGDIHAFVDARNLQVQATSRECVSFEVELTITVAVTRRGIISLPTPTTEHSAAYPSPVPDALPEPGRIALYPDEYPVPGQRLPVGRFMNSELGSAPFTRPIEGDHPPTCSILPGDEASNLTPVSRSAVTDYDGVPGVYNTIDSLASNAVRSMVNGRPEPIREEEPPAVIQYTDEDTGYTYVRMPTRRRGKRASAARCFLK